MSDLKVDCDWRDGTLYIVLSKDPERIGVRLFPSRQAPVRRYVPEAELLQLKERYAKLLDEKIDAYNDMRAATLEADELGAENAELRELVLQLWECPVDDSKCTDCPHCKEHYDVCAGETHCKLYDRMRELRLEVSND